MFAKYYDQLMADIDYSVWTDFLSIHLDKEMIGFDFGCGTGLLTSVLVKNGFNIQGFDNDPVAVAISLKRNLQVFNHDILTPLQVKADYVLMMFDVINYFTDPVLVFTNIKDTLNQNGVLIFDFYSQEYLKEINNYAEVETMPFSYQWLIKVSDKIMTHDFKTDGFQTQISQYCYETKFYKKLLRQLGFVVKVISGPDERKVYIKAKKVSSQCI